MTITIAPPIEAQLRKKAEAEGISIEAYVERLIHEDAEWAELAENSIDERDPDFQDTRSAVMEGLEQAERGEGRPAEHVFADLRARHGISR